MKSRKHAPAPHVYRIAELSSWGRFRETIAQVGGEWSNQDEAHSALESHCQARGISMGGRRCIFVAVPVRNGRRFESLARTVDRFEHPVWTHADFRSATPAKRAEEVAA